MPSVSLSDLPLADLYHTKTLVSSSVMSPIPSQQQKTGLKYPFIHSSIHLDSSVSSDSDSDDYVIPPDASFGYVEPV